MGLGGRPMSGPEADEGLCAAVGRAFAATGPLDRADPDYVERDVQQRFAQAVAQALVERSALVAEAVAQFPQSQGGGRGAGR